MKTELDTKHRLNNYVKRNVGDNDDDLEIIRSKDTIFAFDLDDLTPVECIQKYEEHTCRIGTRNARVQYGKCQSR